MLAGTGDEADEGPAEPLTAGEFGAWTEGVGGSLAFNFPFCIMLALAWSTVPDGESGRELEVGGALVGARKVAEGCGDDVGCAEKARLSGIGKAESLQARKSRSSWFYQYVTWVCEVDRTCILGASLPFLPPWNRRVLEGDCAKNCFSLC